MSWIGLRVYRGVLRGSGAHGEADVVLELLFKGSNIELSERMRDIRYYSDQLAWAIILSFRE